MNHTITHEHVSLSRLFLTSHSALDMTNAAYYAKPLTFIEVFQYHSIEILQELSPLFLGLCFEENILAKWKQARHQ